MKWDAFFVGLLLGFCFAFLLLHLLLAFLLLLLLLTLFSYFLFIFTTLYYIFFYRKETKWKKNTKQHILNLHTKKKVQLLYINYCWCWTFLLIFVYLSGWFFFVAVLVVFYLCFIAFFVYCLRCKVSLSEFSFCY